jgi:carboxypeptidase family protein
MKLDQLQRLIVLVAAVGLASTLWGQQQNSGTITGRVLDPKGNSLSGITVIVRGIGEGMNRNRQSVTSDAQGDFLTSGWASGSYMVLAVDERPQQGGGHRALLGNRVLTMVLLSPAIPKASVTLQFGPHTASVVGQIRDAVTNLPVNARLDLTSVSGESWFAGGLPADYRILIPRQTDLTFAISAPGYLTWYYPGAAVKSAGSPLNAPFHITKRVDVLLEPQ